MIVLDLGAIIERTRGFELVIAYRMPWSTNWSEVTGHLSDCWMPLSFMGQFL